MNTIIDLNNLANVNFNNESSYAISFGTNAGNTTATIDAFGSGNIARQTPLNSITSPVRDLLIDVQFSNVGAVNMAYAGPFANIGILQTAPAAWRVSGIRSVAQYDEAFANVRYFDLTGSANTSPEYSYITTVNDQSGNTRTWNTTVDVRTPPVLTNTGNVLFDEDAVANITQLIISGNTSASSTYVLTSSIRNQAGQVSNTTATGNSVTITGNIATITTSVASGNLKFVPAPDLATNVANALNFQLSLNNRLASQANANVQVGNTQAEFTITTAFNYTEDTPVTMVFDITDTNPRVNDYSILWQQIIPDPVLTPGRFAINGVAQPLGDPAAITASKATINAANVSYLPPSNYSSNVVLTYRQWANVETYGNVAQGTSNATLTNTVSTPEYNALGANTISFIRDRISLNNWSIPDNDIPVVFGGPRTYTWQLNNVSNVGNIWLNGVRQTSNVITLSGNLTTINSSLANVSSYWEETANAEFTTAGFTTANTVFNFNLDRTGPDPRVLASNVISNVTVNVPSTNDTRNNLSWQGGFYTGSNNGNIATIVWPYISGNVGEPFGFDIPGYTNRFTTSSITTGPNVNSTTDGYNNTETLKLVGFVSANVCIQPAHWTSVTTENNKSDWYLPSSTQIVTTVNNLGTRLTPQISDPIWTSTVVAGSGSTNDIIWYNPFVGNTEVANSYANLRTQTGNAIQTARTVPHREVWTQSNYYNIPYTNTGTNGVRKNLSDWYVGLREDSYTYNVNLNCDAGNFLSNGSVTLGNTYSRNAIAGGSQLHTGSATGVAYIPPVSGNTANITITVTRNDGLVVLNNATRQINLSAANIGADWTFSQGGFYGGEFDSTGGSTPDVYLVYSTEQPGSFTGLEFVDSNVNIAMPALNSQFDGPNNTTALNSFDSANLLVIANAVSYQNTVAGVTRSDWYLPSISEMNTANVLGWSSTVNLDTNPTRPRKVAYREKLVITGRGNITFQEMFTLDRKEVWTPMRRVDK